MLSSVKIWMFFLLCTPLYAASVGEWDIGGKVAVVKTGDGYGVSTGVKCEYRFLTICTWRTDVEALLHGVADLSRLDISIPSNLLWYPLGSRYNIDPYAGPGIMFIHTWNNSNTLGVNVLAGVNFSLVKGKVFGIEVKYAVPLLPKPAAGNIAVGLTGTWEVEF